VLHVLSKSIERCASGRSVVERLLCTVSNSVKNIKTHLGEPWLYSLDHRIQQRIVHAPSSSRNHHHIYEPNIEQQAQEPQESCYTVDAEVECRSIGRIWGLRNR
jgi:hypothetical protein